jgi:hypothetical protein
VSFAKEVVGIVEKIGESDVRVLEPEVVGVWVSAWSFAF